MIRVDLGTLQSGPTIEGTIAVAVLYGLFLFYIGNSVVKKVWSLIKRKNNG